MITKPLLNLISEWWLSRVCERWGILANRSSQTSINISAKKVCEKCSQSETDLTSQCWTARYIVMSGFGIWMKISTCCMKITALSAVESSWSGQWKVGKLRKRESTRLTLTCPEKCLMMSGWRLTTLRTEVSFISLSWSQEKNKTGSKVNNQQGQNIQQGQVAG